MPISSSKLAGDLITLRLASLRYYDVLPAVTTAMGVLTLLDRPADAKIARCLEQRAAQGFILELWERDDLHARCPSIRADYALHSPADRAVDGVKLVYHWVASAAARGAEFHWETTVTAPMIGNWAKRDWVVLTNGLGLNDFLPVPRVQPVGGQAIRLRCPDLAIATVIHWATADPIMPDLNLVPRGEGMFDLGATVEFLPYTLPQPLHPQRLLNAAASICPPLGQGEIVATWWGDRPRPIQTRSPIIGFLEPRILVATGHYRNGILMAPITAAIVRDLITEGHSSHPWQFLCPDFLTAHG
jgi:glycine/D-amino acid oxidase-like deaminating enzyme